MKRLLVVVLLLLPFSAFAGTWNLDLNLASRHNEAWARQTLNQDNPGLGLTYQASRTWGYSLGVYKNSYRKATIYALADYTPLHLGHQGWRLDAGLAAGLASGYTRQEVGCAPFVAGGLIKIATPSGMGLNLFVVPNMPHHSSGFVGLQMTIPLAIR